MLAALATMATAVCLFLACGTIAAVVLGWWADL